MKANFEYAVAWTSASASRLGFLLLGLGAATGCLASESARVFREYPGMMLTVLGMLLLAQVATIGALLTQRRQRLRADAQAAARGSELARAARFAAAGELSASIAHEVRQPLSAILSNAEAAELLVTSPHVDFDELHDILADVKRDALRASDVVQRLRALLEKQGVVFKPLQLDATLADALALVAPEARRRAILIDTQFGAGGLEVNGDHVQLQQVLLNLAVNAMDAMQESAPENRVLSVATKRLGAGVEIVVADRGSGFRAASPQQLFEPFYTTKLHGMGLGLSIVRSIVAAHHGRVSAALREGGGTGIVIWLPLARARENAPGRNAHSACVAVADDVPQGRPRGADCVPQAVEQRTAF